VPLDRSDRTILTAEERERRAATMRLLEERIAYHERKLGEERAASDQADS
jgi:hypothetical protein